jgi:hypothetical protein
MQVGCTNIIQEWRHALETKRWDVITRVFEMFNDAELKNKNDKILQIKLYERSE